MGQQVLNGVFLGSIYALFAVGYTLVFGVLDILNLAHQAVFMLAAFAANLTLLGRPFFAWLFLGQAAFYGLGALPATVRPVPVLGAVASATRYFIVLNVGLGLGFVRFALGLQRPFWSTTPRSGGPILTRTATPGGGLGGGRRGPLR